MILFLTDDDRMILTENVHLNLKNSSTYFVFVIFPSSFIGFCENFVSIFCP